MNSIVISPQIQITQVAQNKPNKNFRDQPLIRVGRDDSLEIYRILLQFPITSIPENAVIIESFLKLYMQVAGAGQQGSIITPYTIDTSWDINTVTWNNQPSFSTTLLGSSQKANNFLTQHSFDITTIVQQWYNTSIVNNGIILKTPEVQNKTLANVQANVFSSAYIPVVDIHYALKCDCVCPSTVFKEGIETISTSSSDHYSVTRDTSLTKTVTFFIKNTGLATVSANLQISPDSVDYIDNPEIQLINPGELLVFEPYVFAKYTRVRVRNVNIGETSTLTIWYQSQE